MKRHILQGTGWAPAWRGGFGLALLLSGAMTTLRADVVEMQNGERYVGQVLSLVGDTLVVQSEVLGKLEIPRGKVAVIGLGANAVTNLARLRAPARPQARADSGVATNSAQDFSTALRQLGLNTNLVQQVQRQYLSGAGPEATDKFNELLGGLMTGKLNMEDIRSQAQTAADQIRSLKKEMGDDAGWTMDAYLGILQHFLKETVPPGGSATNAPATRSPKSEPAEAE